MPQQTCQEEGSIRLSTANLESPSVYSWDFDLCDSIALLDLKISSTLKILSVVVDSMLLRFVTIH